MSRRMTGRVLVVVLLIFALSACGGNHESSPDRTETDAPPIRTIDNSETPDSGTNSDSEDNSLVNNNDFSGIDQGSRIDFDNGKKECDLYHEQVHLPSYDVPAAPLVTTKKERKEVENQDVPFIDGTVHHIFLYDAKVKITGSTFQWIDWAELSVVDFEGNHHWLINASSISGNNPSLALRRDLDLRPYISESKIKVHLISYARAPATNRDVTASFEILILRNCTEQ